MTNTIGELIFNVPPDRQNGNTLHPPTPKTPEIDDDFAKGLGADDLIDGVEIAGAPKTMAYLADGAHVLA